MTRPKRNPEEAALSIIKRLRADGYVAILAGGCVRDMLLGLKPKDYDVATDATPNQVGGLYPKARKVGAKFGVMLVRSCGQEVEVATFRSDESYSDGRRPDAVRFSTEIEDAQRRDFTINGMFFDPFEKRVIDHVEGQRDLRAKIVRTIGDPQRRFEEDHLRMLRAVRFASRLGFVIEPDTLAAIRQFASRLAQISAERIWMELEAILSAPTRATGWSLLLDTALQAHLVRGWTCDQEESQEVSRRLEVLPPHPVDPALVLAVVLYQRSPAQANTIGRKLKLGNRDREGVVFLLRSLPALREEQDLDLADLKTLMANPQWTNLLELFRVDESAATGGQETFERVRRRADAIDPEKISPSPLLTGDDLMSMGVSEGPELGRLLKAVYRAQLNEEIDTQEEARSLAEEIRKSSHDRS